MAGFFVCIPFTHRVVHFGTSTPGSRQALLGQLRQLRQVPSADGLVPWRTALEAKLPGHAATGVRVAYEKPA